MEAITNTAQFEGSCSQMPAEVVDEYFFDAPERNQTAKVKMAKHICEQCVALPECFIWGLATRPSHGIVGGTTKKDRDSILSFGGDVA